MPRIDLWTALLGAALIIALLAYVIRNPLQAIGRFVRGLAVGGAVIWAANWLGQAHQFHVPWNPFTAAILGLFGLPGALALLWLRWWLPV
ncbi:MAG: pro-sigmaK processing inhibitor BofA family protein [Kyrpidia sp.]|nr:pro-sigmaK processing inhibitor BofA family protein [Kyrpidia sp.]